MNFTDEDVQLARGFQNNNKYIIIPQKKAIIHLTWKAGTTSLKSYLRCFAGNQSQIVDTWPSGYFRDSPLEEDESSDEEEGSSEGQNVSLKLRGEVVLRATPSEIASYYHVGMIRDPIVRFISAFRYVTLAFLGEGCTAV